MFDSNVTAVLVSAIAMAVLAINNDHVKPRLAKKCRIPVPIELIVVVVGTVVSYFMNLHDTHGLSTIGTNES
jgi:MFS superfamily sulfate permease-like transporter